MKPCRKYGGVVGVYLANCARKLSGTTLSDIMERRGEAGTAPTPTTVTTVFVSRKAQLEIMGLVVVVILISLGFLFALQFVVLEAPENPRETFTREQLAQNTLHTLVLTTTRCQGLDMTALMQDCFDSLSDLDCNGMTSCEFVSKTTSTILDDTLKTWQKDYDFTLTRGTNIPVRLLNKGCPNDRDVGRMFLPSRNGGDKILVRLDVCD